MLTNFWSKSSGYSFKKPYRFTQTSQLLSLESKSMITPTRRICLDAGSNFKSKLGNKLTPGLSQNFDAPALVFGHGSTGVQFDDMAHAHYVTVFRERDMVWSSGLARYRKAFVTRCSKRVHNRTRFVTARNNKGPFPQKTRYRKKYSFLLNSNENSAMDKPYLKTQIQMEI
uniref:Uncharacterized protein n=1 Tax=Romanomermis culicivorax TaxID=13658 RepID=A0A915JPQ2_ROMCU